MLKIDIDLKRKNQEIKTTRPKMKSCFNLFDFSRFQITGFIWTILLVRRNFGAVFKVNLFWKDHKILRNLSLDFNDTTSNVKTKRDFFFKFILAFAENQLSWIPECFRFSNSCLYSREAFLPRSVVTGSRKWHDICL